MPRELRLSIGQFSDKGRKDTNQDFHGALIPKEPLLGTKGIVVALADGISSSDVSHIASESAVKSLLTDYYCTSDAWSVKTSAQRVITATNSWLHAETRRGRYPYDRDKGYVCTLSAMVFKANNAHIFHVGDGRIYRVAGRALEQLTDDHRVIVSSEQSYLGRALGMNPQVEIDYRQLATEQGDTFVLATDGVYDHVSARSLLETIAAHPDDLDQAARIIVGDAHTKGSADNLTIQIVRVDELPAGRSSDGFAPSELPPPPLLEARMSFDGYRIVREIHGSSRSHVYLAVDVDDGTAVALKTPSLDLRGDAAYLRRFMMEEWIARRIDSPHVLKPRPHARKRNYLYVAMEFVEGRTLTQWMVDNPKPELEAVRSIVEQIARGLGAFHRMEMLHQDLRPDNVMIDGTGTVKIVDFGSTRVAGVAEAAPPTAGDDILGTVQYTAPEYFLGEAGSTRSDMFSLGVIAYQMLTGTLPYGADAARARTRAQQRKLRYRSALRQSPDIPVWIDGAIERAVHPEPNRRYEALSEFTFDLRHPNPRYAEASRPPLIERNPTLIWQILCLTLIGVILVLLVLQHGMR